MKEGRCGKIWTYQKLGQVFIWDVGQLLAVEFGDDELSCVSGWVRRYAECSG